MRKGNHSFTFYFILISIIVLFSNCGGLTSQSVDLNDRMKVYQNTPLEVFKAIQDYCLTEGYTIEMSDKELGTLSTGYKSRGGIMKEGRIKLNFNISKLGDDKSKLVIIATIEEQDKRGNWHADQSISGAWTDLYKIMLNDISSRL